MDIGLTLFMIFYNYIHSCLPVYCSVWREACAPSLLFIDFVLVCSCDDLLTELLNCLVLKRNS